MSKHLVCVTLALAVICGCDKSSKSDEDEAVETTEPGSTETVSEIERKKLLDGEPIRLQRVAEPELSDIVRSDSGEFVCLEEVLAEEDRLIAFLSSECFPKPSGVNHSLFAAAEPKQLASFGRFRRRDGYGAALDQILVGHPGKMRIVELDDGSMHEMKAGEGSVDYHLVEDSPWVLAVHRPEEGARRVGAMKGLEKRLPESLHETEYLPKGEVGWDADRERLVYRSRECTRVSLPPDGKPECDVNLPPNLVRPGSIWTDDWLVSQGTDPAVVELDGPKVSDPATMCENASAVPIPPELGLARMLIMCANDRTYHLWTPEKTLRVPGAGWVSGTVDGPLAELGKPAIGGDGERVWLDLERPALWEPEGMRLVAEGVAVGGEDGTRVFHIDDDRKARLLGEVKCDGELGVAHVGREVIGVFCSKPGPSNPGPEHRCRSNSVGGAVDHAVAFDLREGKRYDTDLPVVGATDDAILVGDVRWFVNMKKPCRMTRLSSIPRK